MTATTERCPGCHGSGIEMSGVTYAGMSEYVGCHECGPECPDDCGCRASDATERPESIAPRHPGATQSPDGSPRAAEHVEITPDGNVQVMTTSWHEGSPYSCARPGCPAGCDRNDPTTEAPSDVRPSPPARDAVSMDSAVTDTRWSLLADKAALLGARLRLTGEVVRLTELAEAKDQFFLASRSELIGERDRARGTAATLEAENARLVEEATVSAALLETEIAKREAAEMRANRATADLDALESEDRRQDVQAKHWREVLRIRRELDGIRREMNDVTEIIAKALGYRPSGLPLDGWPHLSTTGDHTPTSLAAEAAGVLAKASRLRAGIEALAAEMQSDTCPSCHVSYADEGSTTWGCDHTEGMQHAGDMLRALLAEGGE